ncbi:DUF4190 domain-containing protein [Nonomuraea sp. NPDC050556]|uniref:DUF4190 domain-containing protein n=1 Tax=Nonomuraea sp. NPDC050556 TaxID=3364369 RepID=UPI00378CBB40
MSYPQYGGQAQHPNGTTILVLGILSLVVCGFLGPFAWVMGNRALAEMDESGYTYENRGMVTAGRICGMIATILMLIGIGLFVILAVVGGLGAVMSTS